MKGVGLRRSPIALVALLWCGALQGCASIRVGIDSRNSEDLQQLARHMAGVFSSERQAERDSSFYAVTLKMAPIWVERDDGYWFYVEQAMHDHLSRPYRQRVYHLTEPEQGLFRSDVFMMESPLRFTGAWNRRAPLAKLTPDSLELRDGCAILLHRQASGTYRGGTRGQSCESSLRGASYATSEVLINERVVASWDRGFDTGGRQVWGAVSGPYVFDKIHDWSDRLGLVGAEQEPEGTSGWGRPPRCAADR